MMARRGSAFDLTHRFRAGFANLTMPTRQPVMAGGIRLQTIAMTARAQVMRRPDKFIGLPRQGWQSGADHRGLTACIFDVDGVLLASPHERAWREALETRAEQERFTTAFYQAHVAGRPRLSGALAALEALDTPNAAQRAPAYAERKQQRLEELIAAGDVVAFPDALRFVQAVRMLGWPMAVASSSKNASAMLQQVRLDTGGSLLELFSANVCGRDLPRGKPDPAVFLLAAAELAVPAACCLVVEDAVAGIEAARAGDMTALGVARLHDAALLQAAGASLVVTSLDAIALHELAQGRLMSSVGA